MTLPAPVGWCVEDGVAVLSLCRPEQANALSPGMADMISALLAEHAAAGGGPVVVESTGPSFCAGVDLDDAPADGAGGEWVRRILAMQHALALHPGAVVVAVQGAAIGSGAEICTAADAVVATPNATFAFPELKIGTAPGISTTRLARAVGEGRARQILLSGRTVRADEALAIGLVHRVVGPDELAEQARAVARRMAVPDSAMVTWLKQELEGQPLDLGRIAAELGPSVDRAFAAAQARGAGR